MKQGRARTSSSTVASSANELTTIENSLSKSTAYLLSAAGAMKAHRPGKKAHWLLTAGLLVASLLPAQGQVLATQRAGFNLPTNQVAAPNTPGGGVVVGSFFYATDQVAGFRHYQAADPTNADPVNTGILQYDNVSDGMSV